MPEPKTIIRPNVKGALDDVVIEAVSCFRLERMDRDHFWMACYRGDKRIAFAIRATRSGRLVIGVTEDELGAVDDSNETEREIAAMMLRLHPPAV